MLPEYLFQCQCGCNSPYIMDTSLIDGLHIIIDKMKQSIFLRDRPLNIQNGHICINNTSAVCIHDHTDGRSVDIYFPKMEIFQFDIKEIIYSIPQFRYSHNIFYNDYIHLTTHIKEPKYTLLKPNSHKETIMVKNKDKEIITDTNEHKQTKNKQLLEVIKHAIVK